MKKLITILVAMALVVAFTATSQIQRGKKPAQSKPKTEQPQGQNNSTSSKKKKTQKTDSSPKPSSRSGSNSSSTQPSTQEVPARVTAEDPTALDVTFSCNVNEADMYIDGNEYGRPNGTRTLKTGEHQVKLVAEGYEDYTTTIHVAVGSTSFNIKMTKKVPTEPYVPKVEAFTVKGISFDMVYVEGGTFTMGATSEQGSDAESNEKPVHQVTLSDYYIGKTEVTQELWKAVMGKNPSYFKGDLSRPVETVSWKDCQKFITKLNKLTGKRFRLPTEAEWEYAARGGNRSRGYKYAGSDNLGSVAWYDSKSGFTTHPVGTKSPNELGLYDMSGNVWEWCQDWKGGYSSVSQTNPTGPSSGSNRVLRGGCWDSSPGDCRVSDRLVSAEPSYTFYDLGLRLAL